MIAPEILDAMVAAGCTAEQIVAAVKVDAQADADKLARKRSADAERSARRRGRMDVTEHEWLVLRAATFARDGFICAYCNDEDGPHQIDHIVPVGRGGRSTLDNLSVACGPCNASKRDRLLSEWKGTE